MKILIITVSFLFLSLSSGCAMVHHYDAYYGKVIDTETKEPLEGAAVLAVYYTQQLSPGGDVTYYADAQETLTDKSGEFKISSNIVTTFRPLQYFDKYPQFTIFKPGYGCYPEHKYAVPHFDYDSLPENQYVTIELPKLRTREEQLDMPSLNFDIPYEKQKKLVELINEEMESLGATGKYTKESFGRR